MTPEQEIASLKLLNRALTNTLMKQTELNQRVKKNRDWFGICVALTALLTVVTLLTLMVMIGEKL